jgi:hypothetical protein
MSFDPLMKALKENPALAEELKNAKTPRERHAILDAHGIEKPNLDSQFPEAGGLTGNPNTNGYGTPWSKTPNSPNRA